MEDYSVELTEIYPLTRKIKDAALEKNWAKAEDATVTLMLSLSSLTMKFRELQRPLAEVLPFKKDDK